MVRPVLQRDLFNILISFCAPEFLYIVDIEKMYRMIWVHKDDRDLQRILWRQSSSIPMEELLLNTLTYGTSPASFIVQHVRAFSNTTVVLCWLSKAPNKWKIFVKNRVRKLLLVWPSEIGDDLI